MTTKKPEALRLADKYEVDGFLQDHRFAQNHWCMQAAVELRRLHAANTDCMAWYEEARQEITSLQERLEASQKNNCDWAFRTHALEAANAKLRAEIDDLVEKIEAIGAGGVEPLRRRDHFRGATEMVPAGWAISYDGKTPHTVWTEGDGDLIDLEVKRQGGTACKMKLYAQVVKWKHTSK